MESINRIDNITYMKDKLEIIFRFLEENKNYNFQLQKKYYLDLLKPYDNTIDKAISVLWSVADSQSQPKLDKLASFWRKLYKDISRLNTLEGLLKALNDNEIKNGTYQELYERLKDKNCEGWGPKTAALFCNHIYKLHHHPLGDEFKIWEHASFDLEKDNLWLPVDAVIEFIFSEISSYKYNNFEKINKLLKDEYTGDRIVVWDDLWFWGFITQKSYKEFEINGRKKYRKLEWNLDKYWGIRHSPKDEETIGKIEQLAKEFIAILRNCGATEA